MAKRLPTIMSEQEFNELLKVTKKKHYRLAFKLGFLCGLRISEIVKLQPSDVDRDRGLLFIREAKGDKDRYVPFPKMLSRDLSGLPIPCGVRALQIAFKRAALRAKIIKDVHFHTLRHSAASYYLKKGMSLKEVQVLLGHSRIDTTAIYLHANPEDVKNRMEEIWK